MKKIILLEDYNKLGFAGDILLLKSGYIRNFLINYCKVLYVDKNLLFSINNIKNCIINFNFKKKLYLKLLYNSIYNKKFIIKEKYLKNIKKQFWKKKIISFISKFLGFNLKKNQFKLFKNKFKKNIVNINIFDNINILIYIIFMYLR